MPDKCLLCKTRDVNHIKSHLTPAGITKNTYGEKDKELIYTIDPREKEINKYYGREHPQAETTEIKQEPNARKGIFCKQCESNFGVYESAVQTRLNEIVDGIGNGININKTVSSVKFVDVDIHPNILTTFFQSVIWRQCVEQLLDNEDNPLTDEGLEKLRLIVLENISTPIKGIVNKDLPSNPKMLIFTTYNTQSSKTPSFANPNTANTNPLIFFIGPIVLLYWWNTNPTNDFDKITFVDKSLLTDELLLEKAKLTIINEEVWKKIHQQLAETVARQYTRK